ncbi:hypothetical protein PUN28_000820 [Cardiocondyla obscurior]|uniref:Pyridoxal phosphate phosphatase PHOSPHO2 n=1 Tax=Cardiocondyla obscurior TaxID=286306 RepID=A0AAW2H193_9HYME
MDHGALVAFDFDHTICDDNTDTVVQKLLAAGAMSSDVQNLRKSGWLVYMNKIFELLHESSVSASQIKDIIVSIPAVTGMEMLLASLHANGHKVIIISDSNSVFIDYWLRGRQLEHTVSQVFTNPARYDENGRLRVEGYHAQYTCKMSAVNLCKGQVLTNYIQDRRMQGEVFERVVYVGDGRNDLCPILRLSETDLACPRKDYPLIDKLSKLPASLSMKAKVVAWKNGTELQRGLEQIIKIH